MRPSVEYGSYNRVRLEGALNVPLAPTLSARVAFQFNRQDGFIRNNLGPDIGRDKTYNGRAQLRWQPSGNVDNILTLYGSKTPREPAGVYDIFPVAPDPANHGLVEITNGPLFTANCEALGFGTPPAGSTNCLGYIKPSADGPFRISTPTTGFFKRSLWGITNTLNVNFGPTTLTSITNYTKIRKNYKEDNDSTGDPLLDYFSNQNAHQFSQELRLSGNTGTLNWVAGVYYLKIAGDYDVYLDLPLFGFAIGNTYKHDVESYAAFGQGEYAFTDQLTVIAGARLTHDKKTIRLTSLCSLDPDTCTAFNFAPAGTVVSGSYAKNDWSGKLQLVWKPQRDLMFYAGVNRGNKGASLLALAPPTPTTTFRDLVVKPEVLTAYEVGFKTQMFNRRLTLNGDIFYYNYHNFQAYKFEGLAAVLFNAEARNYGAELEANADLGSGLSARLGGSLLHTNVKDVQLPDGTLRDQRSAYAPSAMLIGNLRKEFQASSGKFFTQGGFTYASSRYFSTVNEPALKAGPYTVFDASVGYIAKDGRWDATLMVNNLTNKAYPIYQAELASIGGYGIRSFAPPRWISLQLGFHF